MTREAAIVTYARFQVLQAQAKQGRSIIATLDAAIYKAHRSDAHVGNTKALGNIDNDVRTIIGYRGQYFYFIG